MSTRLFEGNEHAYCYQKYRFLPPQEVQDMICSYLGEKLTNPYGLAVDVGCGSGQGTRILAPYFEMVLGTDISEAQIEEAKKEAGLSNVTFRVTPAEDIPVDNASVDLITAFCAVHWFNVEKFLKEVDRALKPHGCLALFSYLLCMDVHYKNQSEQMSKVYTEVQDFLQQYEHEKVQHVRTSYKEIFEVIPYKDKKRIDGIVTKITMTLAEFMGFIQTLSMFQTFHRCEPEKAKNFIKTTEQRFLEIMKVSSNETKIEVWSRNVLLLASKPK
ncbi:putative methyltransferase DDB_G0268948 [Pseudophryne corroboree]|uniref:putative methyltransferase DDB_G0268948 n=1 Tax=Pseudophryne corroboree TaxID=495146 RepID=UPI0030814A12